MRLQHFSSVDGRHKRLSPKFFLGAALALGLTATAFTQPAEAATIRLGAVDVQIDTTVSAGVSVLMSEREEQFLPVSNGGPDVNQVFIQPNGDGSPNIAYDNPMTNGDGMGTSDQYDGYNGAPDRYDWTVLGKMVKLSQQNNYNSVMTPYDQLLQPGHANPEAMRYEPRRQWVVEGSLKGGARHIYAKRVLRLDEDSWQMTAGELYDGRGELWRIQEIGQAPDYRPEAKTCWTTGGEFIYDLLAGRYMGVGMKSGRPANFVTGLERLTPDYYTPANVRRLGR